ncbi:MAG: helix-hairpin-helix domain-containing protein [Candidatus Omnitrophica bacterium]|nr:helix-hairpin-helix domain-containing protein [Candidatus Omnitrophota bacterium]
MIHLTQQERQVFLFVGLVIVAGLGLDLSLKGHGDRVRVLHILDDPSFFPRVNVNTASFEDLVALPRMNPTTAHAIIDYRKANGPFKTLEDVRIAAGISKGKWRRLEGCLKVNRQSGVSGQQSAVSRK